MAKVAAAERPTIHGVIRAAARARETLHGKFYGPADFILGQFKDGPWPRGQRKSLELIDLIEEEMCIYEELTGQWPPHG